MKYVKEKLENYNGLLAEASKEQIKPNDILCYDHYEVLRVKKYLEKILRQIYSEKVSVTYINKELSLIYKYYKEIETSKDQLQSCIDILSTNIGITRCQASGENVVLEEK